jgi:hypothetical protein
VPYHALKTALCTTPSSATSAGCSRTVYPSLHPSRSAATSTGSDAMLWRSRSTLPYSVCACSRRALSATHSAAQTTRESVHRPGSSRWRDTRGSSGACCTIVAYECRQMDQTVFWVRSLTCGRRCSTSASSSTLGKIALPLDLRYYLRGDRSGSRNPCVLAHSYPRMKERIIPRLASKWRRRNGAHVSDTSHSSSSPYMSRKQSHIH